MSDYLLEVGLEEMPAHLVTSSERQLVDLLEKFLKKNRVSFNKIVPYSTPRRLALLVKNIALSTQAVDEENRGPSLKIAKNQSGEWTKAAIGFAHGQKIDTDDLIEKDGYVYAQKHVDGIDSKLILKNIGSQVIEKMRFSTYMRWANFDLEYIRPIRWLVSLFDEEVVPFKILNVASGRYSRGHRFLGHQKLEIKKADQYEASLKKEFVIVDSDKRKQIIVDQLKDLAKKNNWVLKIDQNLLEEVNNIVEYPTAFAGSFDKKYLQLPDIVLITSMRDNQRFFYVTDQQGALLPYFVSVRNGDSNYLQNVVSGNEKVLVARLEDAEFFYNEDLKRSIDYFVKKTDHLVFHEKIGSMTQHMQRVEEIALSLSSQLKLDKNETEDLVRASEIYKFDLNTAMVGEFSELQGKMAGIYAEKFGENKQVSAALGEQYLPDSSEGDLPKSKLGALLSLSDKLDQIFAFFSIGQVPKGSNDPYGLRRAALGIVRIIKEFSFDFSLNKLVSDISKNSLDKECFSKLKKTYTSESNLNSIIDFIVDRIRQVENNTRYDILDTVLTKTETGNILSLFKSISLLKKHADDSDFRDVIESLSRVQNLSKKNTEYKPIDETLFVNDSEKNLYAASLKLAQQKDIADDPEDFYQKLASLKNVINDYFQENMIMDNDEKIRVNRLSQLSLLNSYISKLGSLNKLIIK